MGGGGLENQIFKFEEIIIIYFKKIKRLKWCEETNIYKGYLDTESKRFTCVFDVMTCVHTSEKFF